MCSAIPSICFCAVNPSASVSSKSRSPTVSRPRRSEPAGVTDSTPFGYLLMCSMIAAAAVLGGIEAKPSSRSLVVLQPPSECSARSSRRNPACLAACLPWRLLHVGHGRRFEVGPQKRNFLRSKRLQVQEYRAAWPDISSAASAAGCNRRSSGSLQMCSAIRSPMPGSSSSLPASLRKLFDRLVHAGDQLGRLLISPIAPDDRAIDLQQLRGFSEDLREGLVVHAGDYKARCAS